MKKRITSLLIVFAMVLTMFPMEEVNVSANKSEGNWQFTVSSGTATVTGYTGTNTNLVIPSTLGGFPVTHIGMGAFAFTNLTSVVIPDSVTFIGSGQFAGDGAFSHTNLTSVTFESATPPQFGHIGFGVFSGINPRPTIYVPCGAYSAYRAIIELGLGRFYIGCDCTLPSSGTLPCTCNNCSDCGFTGGTYGLGDIRNRPNFQGPDITDALWIVQHVVGLRTLTGDALIAARIDGSRNSGFNQNRPVGIVDALRVVQFVVNLPSPDLDRIWR